MIINKPDIVLIKVTNLTYRKKMQGALHLHFSRSITTQVIHQNMKNVDFGIFLASTTEPAYNLLKSNYNFLGMFLFKS